MTYKTEIESPTTCIIWNNIPPKYSKQKKCYKILLYLLRLPEAFLISDGRLFKILTHE
jgi:hypothetical protein